MRKVLVGAFVALIIVLRVARLLHLTHSTSSPPSYSRPTPPGVGTLAGLTLSQARARHATSLTRTIKEGTPPPPPPAGVFDLVHYPAKPGPMPAYVTPDPGDGQRHPAIVWITGGDCNTINALWDDAPRENDQTAAPYRKAGIVLMFPALRGGNDAPGSQEKFLGEVDDVLAAADYLAAQPWVDPARVYLGGHSTGGTLALLTSEASGRFRAVFSFGPTNNIRNYGDGLGEWPFDLNDESEAKVRSPGFWLASVRSPTFVLEGAEQSNAEAVEQMRDHNRNPALHWFIVPGKSHFSVLAPANELIAQKILADTGPATAIDITPDDVQTIGSR